MAGRGWWSALAACARGGVLLEYLVVTLVVVTPLVGVSDVVFETSGQAFNIQGLAEGNVDNFGFLGQTFVDRWRMIMSGIALPFP